jgi:hypothetical protein
LPHTWYVTFEIKKRGSLRRPRSPRVTRTFETENEAKDFARARMDEGLSVYAGTLNPHAPKQLVVASNIPSWLEAQ